MAGERSGSLEQVLRRYVSYVQVISAVQRRVVSALVYPAVLTLLSFAVVAIIVVRVVPEFNEFYKGFNAQLPLATRVIVAVSAAIRGQIVLIALGDGGRSSWGPGGRCVSPNTAGASTDWCCGCPASAASPASSRPRSWRGRWPRCSAAASRW